MSADFSYKYVTGYITPTRYKTKQPELVTAAEIEEAQSEVRSMTRMHRCDMCDELLAGGVSTQSYPCFMSCIGTAHFDHRIFRMNDGRFLRLDE